MVRKRTKYSDTFKAEAVKMVMDGSRPIATVASSWTSTRARSVCG
jgi:transposase